MKQYIRISLFFAVILVNITCIKDKNLAYLYKGNFTSVNFYDLKIDLILLKI